MPGEHAVLSPSAAERWLSCPASVEMESHVPPEPDNIYAQEGTAAHELAEIATRLALGEIDMKTAAAAEREWWKRNRDYVEDRDEMVEYVNLHVALVLERRDAYPNSTVLLEQRMPTGIDSCWGTADVVIVSPVHIEIIDLKYGKGVAVEAEGNPQLRLYALGALDTFGELLGEVEEVLSTVHQPRLDHVLTERLSVEEIRVWRDEITPVAQVALKGGPDAWFGPSEAACRWCPASGRCKAQLEDIFAVEHFDAEPTELTLEEMAETLDHLPRIRDWLSAFEQAALTVAYSEGKQIPGYKVVLSGGRRSITDPEGALAALREKGYPDDKICSPAKPKGIGELEKLLKKEFETVVGPFVAKSEGKPSLVPESDKRSAINPDSEAQKTFQEEA